MRAAFFQVAQAAIVLGDAALTIDFAHAGDIGWAAFSIGAALIFAATVGASIARDGLLGWRH